MGSNLQVRSKELLRPATLALYAAAVVVLADMYLTQPILPLLSDEFGVTPAVAGLSVSFVVFFIALASTAFGPLGDKLGRKQVMVGSMFLLAATLPRDTRPQAASWRRSYSGMLAHLGNRRLLGAFLIGGTLGAALPGLAWQALTWPGVAAVCAGAFALALAANWILCQDELPRLELH